MFAFVGRRVTSLVKPGAEKSALVMVVPLDGTVGTVMETYVIDVKSRCRGGLSGCL